MRENCTSGSVRGEGGNILTYSAGDFDNASRLIELLEARVGVGLQRALVELQVPLRVLALAVRGVGEPYRGRGLVARGPVVAHIGPEPSGLGLAVPGASTGTGVSSAYNFVAARTCFRTASTNGLSNSLVAPTHPASVERSRSTPSRA